MKKDIRSQLTENLIKDSLSELLLEKDIQKITVSELTKKAGIARSTFYQYYNNIDNMFEEILKEYFDEYSQKIDDIFTEDKPLLYKIEKTTFCSFQAVKAYSPLSILALALNHNVYIPYVNEYLDYISNKYMLLLKDYLCEDDKVLVDFLIGGTLKAIKTWIQTGMEKSEKEMVSIILKIVLNTLKESHGSLIHSVI